MFDTVKEAACKYYVVLSIILFLTWLLSKNRRYRWFYIIYKTWRRDMKGLWTVGRALYQIIDFEKRKQTVPKLFTEVAQKRPNKVAFYFENEVWTFQKIELFSNKVANYFATAGYEKGDTVALLLENRPEYIATWLGLSKIGVVTALINTNLVSQQLYHCIKAAKVKVLIFGSDYVKAVNDISDKLENDNIKLIQYNTSSDESYKNNLKDCLDFKQCLEDRSVASPNKLIAATYPKDSILYIYTSGTTGLPKPAKITHSRFIFAVTGTNSFLSLNDEDNFYNPLPLYHATGGMLTIGQCVIFGVTTTLRKKFSATNFWTDCQKYKCTVANYIGETCRYILAANKDRTVVKHGVTRMFGNGLKKEIWKEFVNTFNISMYEFYGSTEGNSNLINLDNTVGAVGFVPIYLSSIVPLCLIKCDEETKEPLRNKQGFCIKTKNNEPGILIGKIYKKISIQKFDGYVDTNETNKKILHNVFREGDFFFNSGDLMIRDEFGYYYFKDRTGDTYRWKGENIATTEIEFVISQIIGPIDTVVYGVEVPNTEGRAGMVAITDPNKSVDTKVLAEGLKSNLPSYAIPLFLRIMDKLPMTGTFKVKKNELQKEGFKVDVITDAVYVYDSKSIEYIPITNVYDDIVSGKFRL